MMKKINNLHVATFFTLTIYFLSVQIVFGESRLDQEPTIAGDSLDLSTLSLDPEEQAGADALEKLGGIVSNLLNDVYEPFDGLNYPLGIFNSSISNSGSSEGFSKLGAYVKKVENLSNGLDANNVRLSNKNLKKAYKVIGRDKLGQVRELQKKAKSMTRKLKGLKILGTAMTIVDPGSKILGNMAAGDYYGAALQLVSGTCKFGLTTGAAALGTIAGTAIAGPGGGVVGGTALAAGADSLYETNITPYFDSINQAHAYTNKIDELVHNHILQSYSNIEAGGASLAVRIKQYMEGEITIKQFRSVVHPIREKLKIQNAKLQKEHDTNKKKVVKALRSVENKSLNITPLIDRLDKGKLNKEGERQLLKALKRKYVDRCKEKVASEFVLSELSRLNHIKFLDTLKKLNITSIDPYLDCLCRSAAYGNSGTSQFYHPGTLGNYDDRYSCQHPGEPCIVAGYGCGRYPLPKLTANSTCMQIMRIGIKKDSDGNIIMQTDSDGKIKKDEKGQPIPTGMRLDEKILRELLKREK